MLSHAADVRDGWYTMDGIRLYKIMIYENNVYSDGTTVGRVTSILSRGTSVTKK